MSGIDLGYSYELGSGQTRIGVMTRPRWGLGMVMTGHHIYCADCRTVGVERSVIFER